MYLFFTHCENKEFILRVLRIILVILLEHPSDTYVFTMKMEILLEPTSNKLMVGGFGRSDTHARNPVKEILLKIESTWSQVHIKMEVVSTYSSRVKFIATCSYSRLNDLTTSRENDLKLPQL
ncbi:hypothetical protein Tco_1310682 [Tanacetum coccineum]